jgi:dGTPase
MKLALYASHPSNSKGRLFNESIASSRNDYQRDRDRIIHSASFRRLQYKTQVFVNHEGDMFRSRLTHSLEVSQISRAIARTLYCHDDLAEAVALAHDLGHTPFGHAGQDALNNCMKDFGGFEHNLQSLRVVDFLEKKYGSFDGLNLTFEVREGILKRCSKKNARKLGHIGKRFISGGQPSLEAQIVNYADEIAYIHHDIDDGLRSGIIDFKLLDEIEFFREVSKKVKEKFINLTSEQLTNEVLRRMMSAIISDLCQQSISNLKIYEPKNAEDVRSFPPLINFSRNMSHHIMSIRRFSRSQIYEHPRIILMSERARMIIKALFNFFMFNFESIPLNFRNTSKDTKERVVSDYLAGMTDRYAEELYKKIERNS